MNQKKLNKILIVALALLTLFIAYQQITYPYRHLFNKCYYATGLSDSTMTDEWLDTQRDYCKEWAKEQLDKRGD